MIIMIAAAVAAAAPVAPPQTADAHAQHQGMDMHMQHHAMKHCCCHDMAAKHGDARHNEHGVDRAG